MILDVSRQELIIGFTSLQVVSLSSPEKGGGVIDVSLDVIHVTLMVRPYVREYSFSTLHIQLNDFLGQPEMFLNPFWEALTCFKAPILNQPQYAFTLFYYLT